MGINKAKGNMYPFITHTWNPLAGACPHACTYCSTNNLKHRYPQIDKKYSGKPRQQESEFNTNLGSNNFIFVAAQSDLFAEGVPDSCIDDTLEYCKTFNNRYLFQTKNPLRVLDFCLPENSVICTTIETNRTYPSIMQNCPPTSMRAHAMSLLKQKGFITYATIEPIMDFDYPQMEELLKMCAPEQVNIGADSKGSNLPEPSKEKVLRLIEILEKLTKVVQKSNLKRLLK